MGDRLFDFSSFEVTSVISCDFKYGFFSHLKRWREGLKPELDILNSVLTLTFKLRSREIR